MKKNKKLISKIVVLFIFLISLVLMSFLVGRYKFTLGTVLNILASQFLMLTSQFLELLKLDTLASQLPEIKQYWENTLEVVILQVRFPRIILAVLVGGALSISGASYQTLFKNPMVSPDILGVSAGAGFGAALAMVNDANWIEIQLCAFVFGLLAVSAAYIISNVFGGKSITILVLAGVVTSSFFQALLSIVKTLADTDNQLPSITFWLMGSLSRATNRDILIMLPALCLSLFILFFLRHHINALSAGEDVVQTMGVNVPVVKLSIVISSTLMTVVSVGICGIIGWIGMVIPHLARAITGANYNKMAPVSFLIGGIFLLLVDNVIRGVDSVELPLGVLTALVGTPAFVILLSRARQGWN